MMAIVDTLLILKLSARLRLLTSRSWRFQRSIEAAMRRSTAPVDGDETPMFCFTVQQNEAGKRVKYRSG